MLLLLFSHMQDLMQVQYILTLSVSFNVIFVRKFMFDIDWTFDWRIRLDVKSIAVV